MCSLVPRKAIAFPALLPISASLLAVATALAAPAEASHAALQDSLRPLLFFRGYWSCAGRFANGKAIRSHEVSTPILDGHWLRMRHVDNPPHRYKALELWRYDAAVNRFRVLIFDNSGGVRRYVSPGWQNDTLILNNTAASGYIDRFVFKRHGNANYRVTYAAKTGAGKWKTGDTLICKRVSS